MERARNGKGAAMHNKSQSAKEVERNMALDAQGRAAELL